MSKTLIGIIVGVVVVVGGGALIYSQNDKTNSENEEIINSLPETDSSKPVEDKTVVKKMAFSEFVRGMGAYKCTVNQSVDGTDTTGTVYLSKGLIRGEFNSKVQNLSIDTGFIVRDGYTYTWTSMMPKFGFKTKVDAEVKAADTSTRTQGSYSFNAEKIGDYDCQAWTVDESKFVLPAGVTFRETTK